MQRDFLDVWVNELEVGSVRQEGERKTRGRIGPGQLAHGAGMAERSGPSPTAGASLRRIVDGDLEADRTGRWPPELVGKHVADVGLGVFEHLRVPQVLLVAEQRLV